MNETQTMDMQPDVEEDASAGRQARQEAKQKKELAVLRAKEDKLNRRYADAGAFVLSFPKSGRTWVRTVVAHYLSIRFGIPFDIEFEAEATRFRRPCFTHNYFDVYRYVPGEPVLLQEERLKELPLVLLVRDPRDVCASYFHHIKLRDKRWSGDAIEFARSEVYGIERQSRFVELIMRLYKHHRGPKVLLRYEDLRRSPHDGFRRLLSLIDLEGVDEHALAQAVERSSFERMREEEKSTLLTGVAAAGQARLGVTDWNQDENALKVRKGQVGGYVADFGIRNAIKLTLMPVTRRVILKMKLLPWSAT